MLGKLAFDQGRFREALGEYQRAYDLAPVPELLFNIARCREQLGETAAAIAGYEQYLAAKPNAEDRADVESHLEQLRAGLPSPAPATAPPPTTAPPPLTVAPPAVAPPVASPVTQERPSRRGLWIGLGVGASVVAVGAVLLGVFLGRPTTADPVPGNFKPPYAGINQ